MTISVSLAGRATVHKGKLLDPDNIAATSDEVPQYPVEISRWNRRAMWGWLRLQYSRKIDADVTAELKQAETTKRLELGYEADTPWKQIGSVDRSKIRAERDAALVAFFTARVYTTQEEMKRTLQFIMMGSRVYAVASLKHLLIPPETVYHVADKIFKASGITLKKPEHGLHGMVGYIKDVQGLNFGLQIFGGDIITRQAIKVGCFVRVELCTNPVSWLGIRGGFMGWIKTTDTYERVLRIGRAKDLEPRMIGAISGAQKQLEDLEAALEQTKKVRMTESQGQIISAAMGLSYGLGAKTIQQVWEKFKDEDKTQWGLSMALSYIAAHGDFIHPITQRKTETTPQKLSTVSGAVLMIKDIKDAELKSLGWLKDHIAEGTTKTVDELLKGVI